MSEHKTAGPSSEIAVTMSLDRWKRVASIIDWHGKDHETELIVDAIREQINDN